MALSLKLRDIALSTMFFSVYTLRKLHYDACARGQRKAFRRPDILFSNDCAFWREYLHRDGTLAKDDIILGEVVKAAREEGLSVACVDVGILRRSFKAHPDRLDPDSPWFCIEQVVTYRTLGGSFKTALRWIFSGRPAHEEPLGAFHQVSNSFREAFAYRVADILLNELEPRSVFTGAESLLVHRALARGARVRSVPAFALQHGDIKSNAAYFFPAEIAGAMARNIPSHTFVYSPKDRDALVQRSIYAADAVIVTGNPRWDVLARGKSVYSRQEIARRYGLPSRTSYILWTTKSHRIDKSEAMRVRQAIGNCAQQLKEVAIIVKEHPNAGSGYERRMRRAMASFRENVIVVPMDADTNSLLQLCELLVSYESTTVSEAVASRKPAILFERREILEKSKFVALGVAAGVSDEAQLVPTILRLLQDDSSLVREREAYIEQYLYAIDGLATERVIDQVQRVLAAQSAAASLEQA
jgi:hypothetical protein